MTYREAIKKSLATHKTKRVVFFDTVICDSIDALPVYFPRLLLSISSLIAQIYTELNIEDEEAEESIVDFAIATAGKDNAAMIICLHWIIYNFISWLLDEEAPETDDSKQIWYKTDVILEKFIEFQEEETD